MIKVDRETSAQRTDEEALERRYVEGYQRRPDTSLAGKLGEKMGREVWREETWEEVWASAASARNAHTTAASLRVS